MERILKLVQKLIKCDKSSIADMVQILVTGSQEEKVMAVAVTALVKSTTRAAVPAFVNHYLKTDKSNVDNFISACEMFQVPEENCVELLKLKGIEDIESDDDSKSANDEDDLMKTLKSILED
jgi:hypothetical protein